MILMVEINKNNVKCALVPLTCKWKLVPTIILLWGSILFEKKKHSLSIIVVEIFLLAVMAQKHHETE